MSFEQPHIAYVLRQRPYQNSSQILELFTLEAGRISVVAKGVARAKSAWAGLLRPFARISVAYRGKSELKTLTFAEAASPANPLSGLGLYCGFYANELLLYLLHKEAAHPDTFAAYQALLGHLAHQAFPPLVLRQFEYQLVGELGFGFDVHHDCDNQPIVKEARYVFNHGLRLTDKVTGVPGRCLAYLSQGETQDVECQRALKKLMRARIDDALEGRTLKSRDLLQDYLRVQQ